MNQENLAGQKYPPLDAGAKTILLLSCSPRDGRHTFELLKNAKHSLKEISGINVQLETFADKKILPCQDCFYRCAKEGHCWQDDDFNALARLWLDADGIVIGTPVYTFGPPSPVFAFFERLQTLQQANPVVYLSPFWPQPIGIVAQGGSEYGGAEVCAQTLLALCLKVGCTPISGDMPGFSQGVIGQITDGGAISDRLIRGVQRLSRRVVEFVQILTAGKNIASCPLRLLTIDICDDRTAESFSQRISAALGETRNPNISIEQREFNFEHRQIGPCLGCSEFCSREQECRFQDELQDFMREWLAADVILWLMGQRDGSSLSSIRAAFDRMNQVRFETFFASGYRHMPRYLKVSAPVFSAANAEGQDSTLLYLQHISLLYQNALVPNWTGHRSEFNENYNTKGQTQISHPSAPVFESFMQKSIQLALGLKSGISLLQNDLPEEYFPSAATFAKIDLDAGVLNPLRS